MTSAQRFARLLLGGLGWRVLDLPDRPRKAVVVSYPHTSYWDFFIMMPALIALGAKPRWAATAGLFQGWRGPLLRKMGGIPVNRQKRTGFVQAMNSEFAQNPEFLLILAPEGTRHRTEGWRSGFYRIALAAKVPVIVGVADYERKEVGFAAVIPLTGDEAIDLARIARAYDGRRGYSPGKASPIRLLPSQAPQKRPGAR